MYGDFPAKNTVYTVYMPINVWFWPTLCMYVGAAAGPHDDHEHMYVCVVTKCMCVCAAADPHHDHEHMYVCVCVCVCCDQMHVCVCSNHVHVYVCAAAADPHHDHRGQVHSEPR